MTFAKVFILVVLVSIFLFTAYKLVMQIIEYRKKKKAKVQNESSNDLNNKKEV